MKKKMFCRNGQLFTKNLAKKVFQAFKSQIHKKASKVHAKVTKNPI